jgi:hypothetical protein
LLPNEYRYSATYNTVAPDFRRLFDTPEKETAHVEYIVGELAKFKTLLPQLNALAASAKS